MKPQIVVHLWVQFISFFRHSVVMLLTISFYELKYDIGVVRFQVLTGASMMFRIVFWDVLPCKMIVDRRGAYCLPHHWRQAIPEEHTEHYTRRRENLKSHIVNLYGEATLRCIRRFESLRITHP
jgi:hypothetical protein